MGKAAIAVLMACSFLTGTAQTQKESPPPVPKVKTGDIAPDFTLVDQNGQPRPLLPRTYNSFSQMTGENAQSRIYLGIHWEFDALEGIRCGDEIANYVFTHALTPSSGPRPVPMPAMHPAAQIHLAVRLEVVAADGGLHHR